MAMQKKRQSKKKENTTQKQAFTEQEKTGYSPGEYEKILKKCFRESQREIEELALGDVEDYVRKYAFPKNCFDEIKDSLKSQTLEVALYKRMDGFRNLYDMQNNAIVKSYQRANGVKLETGVRNFLKEKYPVLKNYSVIYKGAFTRNCLKQLHLNMTQFEKKARIIYGHAIRQNADYLRMEHMIFQQQKQFEEAILDHIPERIPDLYPHARRMKRHFILHIGPTNSGKTYEALQELKRAEHGIYLAPLRLLAYEIYDRLRNEGIPCNMITGEEEIHEVGAKHESATIEILNVKEFYDVAVIDEAQMIGDKRRGGAWTRAILGVCAPRVHICADYAPVELITRIIEECGDTYEIFEKERMVPLKMDNEHFQFPDNVREKDALIVFSKKSVIAVTAELQKNGIAASMIYGNLPYDVRMNEVQRFISGETKVVVATDAIGMGLNLPIKRIVFLETKKFDGEIVRPLDSSEIKQIAGRAGRRGIFEVGYYTSEYRRNGIRKAVEGELKKVTTARLGIPESIVAIDLPLSEILTRWSELNDNEIYEKADFSEDITLCTTLEKYVKDKNILYNMITLGIRSSKRNLTELLIQLAMLEETGEDQKEMLFAQVLEENVISEPEKLKNMNMEQLEELYLVYDMFYAFMRKFRHTAHMDEIILRKRECSAEIIELLKTQQLDTRKCKICGCDLSWNYPYTSCLDCYIGRY